MHCGNKRLEKVPGHRYGLQSVHASLHERAAQEVRQLKPAMFLFKQLKMVLIVRSDLKLTKGKLATQVAHAAVICFKNTLEKESSLAKKWLKVGQPKIVLKVDSLAQLEDLKTLAEESNVTTALVLDAGRTQIAPGTATCLGLGPDYDEKLDALVKDLKLL